MRLGGVVAPVRASMLSVLFAVALSGCLTEAGRPSSDRSLEEARAILAEAEALSTCPEGFLYLLDIQSTRAGGSNEDGFTLLGECDLDIELDVSAAAGDVLILVEGPQGPVVEFRRTGAYAPGINIALPPESVARVNEGPAAEGEYRYSFRANAVADFALRISGA